MRNLQGKRPGSACEAYLSLQAIQMKTTMARFPFHKTLESFDFKFQPSIEPKVIKELAAYVAQREH